MVRNDITVDWLVSPRIITVAAPSVAVSVQDLHDTLRTLESVPAALCYPSIVSSGGKEVLGEGVLVGVTTTLLNAKLAFAARGGPAFVQCTVSGGNLVALDEAGNPMSAIQPTSFTQVVLAASSSATLLGGRDAWQTVLGAGLTAGQLMGVVAAVLAGRSTGHPARPRFRNVGDTHDVVVADLDGVGNRSNIEVTP